MLQFSSIGEAISTECPNRSIEIKVLIAKVDSLSTAFRILKTCTSPGHPQDDEWVERRNRTLIGLVKAFTKEAQPKS